MERSLIVAVADNWAIGKNNDLLWHISQDLQYFKRTTLGCPVIMGYMTFKSLGSRVLPKRKNIVISLFPWDDVPEGVTVVKSLEEAYKEAEAVCDGSPSAPQRCFVMGGGYTYREAIEFTDSMYITHVHTTITDADTFFPEIDESQWYKDSISPTQREGEFSFEYVIYKRK